MTQLDLFDQAKNLSVTERLELIDHLIESVESDAPSPHLPAIRTELDRRYQAFQTNPTEGEPWEIVRERIQRSLDASCHHRTA